MTEIKRGMTELQMQSKCIEWFWNTYRFTTNKRMIHCNMNNSANKVLGALARALGVVAGVSDLELITDGGVVFIELKLPGGKQSDEQIEFMNAVRERGQAYFIIYSFEEFKTLTQKLLQ